MQLEGHAGAGGRGADDLDQLASGNGPDGAITSGTARCAPWGEYKPALERDLLTSPIHVFRIWTDASHRAARSQTAAFS